jgi:Copper type II ascorbate-dependent monooxygenase, C-terminal domain
LTEAEIETIDSWVEAGCTEGDPVDLPPNPQFVEGWTLGQPDLVLELPVDYEVPAVGADIYRCFVIPSNLPADTQVVGLEYRPGNPRVVHHIIGYVDANGEAKKQDAEEDGPGYTCFGGPKIDPSGDLGGWAPGATADFLPEGIGRIIPKSSDIVLQVHYHPTGKPETDRSRVGLYFAKPDHPIKQTFHWWAAGAYDFKIPAGSTDFHLDGAWEMPVDVQLVAVSPHMHLLGRQMTMTAKKPDGTTIDLIRIPNWDFNWQLQYLFDQPIELPAGSVINVEATYDNSAANPNQPVNPPKEVHFGEATTDEMCFGFFGVVKKDQDLTKPGQRDDLLEILEKQAEEYEKKAREGHKSAAGSE